MLDRLVEKGAGKAILRIAETVASRDRRAKQLSKHKVSTAESMIGEEALGMLNGAIERLKQLADSPGRLISSDADLSRFRDLNAAAGPFESFFTSSLTNLSSAQRTHQSRERKNEEKLAKVLHSGEVVSAVSTIQVQGTKGQSLDDLMAEPVMAGLRELVSGSSSELHGMKLVSERSRGGDGAAVHGFVLNGNVSQMQKLVKCLGDYIALNDPDRSVIATRLQHIAGMPKIAPQPSRLFFDYNADDGAFSAAVSKFSCYVDVTGFASKAYVPERLAQSVLERMVPLAEYLPEEGEPVTPAEYVDGLAREVATLLAMAEQAREHKKESGGLER
ncbi:hypothetical protein [Ferrimonas marina]|uniref:Uncharacterized protein n=1 Tax=Ferrimonas marina TaxID=299255 RepID=A0A1M5UAD8_9GAMM|nr:hypothetical protein [Ferrimonas marina]SHH59881.1 hypothetical protein SAMN02745129_2474 [Ferrimonas marina]